ncbi:ATP-binding protein [Streptomyces sp. NPDC052396]|uniref:ATP-binding protein n=1 Tax=Streptomyces sp. NPDC052396 TaxID=3365689 RepID=UPI0037CE9619
MVGNQAELLVQAGTRDAEGMERRPQEANPPSHTSRWVVRPWPAGQPREERFRALTLHADSPDTARVARNTTRDALIDWGLDSRVDDAVLAVSELVGNVIHHAVPDNHLAKPGAPRLVELILHIWPGWLILGVRDEDSDPPTFPSGEAFSLVWAQNTPEAVLPDSGRGLLIATRLADALWWVPEDRGGKTVYCRFDLRVQEESL